VTLRLLRLEVRLIIVINVCRILGANKEGDF